MIGVEKNCGLSVEASVKPSNEHRDVDDCNCGIKRPALCFKSHILSESPTNCNQTQDVTNEQGQDTHDEYKQFFPLCDADYGGEQYDASPYYDLRVILASELKESQTPLIADFGTKHLRDSNFGSTFEHNPKISSIDLLKLAETKDYSNTVSTNFLRISDTASDSSSMWSFASAVGSVPMIYDDQKTDAGEMEEEKGKIKNGLHCCQIGGGKLEEIQNKDGTFTIIKIWRHLRLLDLFR